jgi:hypothetical protein
MRILRIDEWDLHPAFHASSHELEIPVLARNHGMGVAAADLL